MVIVMVFNHTSTILRGQVMLVAVESGRVEQGLVSLVDRRLVVGWLVSWLVNSLRDLVRN